MCINLFGQSDSIATTRPVHIQEKVNIRIPDKSKIEEYKKDARFQYKKEERVYRGGIGYCWQSITLSIIYLVRSLNQEC